MRKPAKTQNNIDVSHNCGDSKTGFWGVFSSFSTPKSRFFDRKPPICLPQLPLALWVTPNALDERLGANSAVFASLSDRKSTVRAFSMSLRALSMSFRDIFMSLRVRREFRLTSHRLRLFDFWKSCGCREMESSQISFHSRFW